MLSFQPYDPETGGSDHAETGVTPTSKSDAEEAGTLFGVAMESALNQTPSRPDNTPSRADTPSHAVAARHRIRELAAQFAGELEEPISDFVARLPDALLDDFSLLLLALDSHVATREMDRENIVWQAVTEHLPGLRQC